MHRDNFALYYICCLSSLLSIDLYAWVKWIMQVSKNAFENCCLWTVSIICTVHLILLKLLNQEGWHWGRGGGRDITRIQNFGRRTPEWKITWRMILKLILVRENVEVFAEFSWLRIGSSGRILSTQLWTLGFHYIEFVEQLNICHLFKKDSVMELIGAVT
jgi:hypothetical protein